jgi:DNA replication and repair protein RecF
MIIRKLTLQDFRNVGEASLSFAGIRQFFVGGNGQGKTNLLEAAGFLTALRSFRAPDSRQVIMHGRAEAGISAAIEREGSGAEQVAVRVRRDGKELWRDGSRVARLADHVGRVPTVFLSSQDIQLLRGAPALRRRWLDLAIASADGEYLAALQTYGRALAGKAALLRRPGASAAEIAAFGRILAPSGARVVELRSARLAEIASAFSEAYARVSGGAEGAGLRYETELSGVGADALLARLEAGRAADLRVGTCQVGPHRDDLRLEIAGASARDFASEGQQRSAMLALKLAQASWTRARVGVRPVILADDVLGELDPERRARFWACLDPESQVIATGTSLPADPGGWQVFAVAAGSFRANPPGMGTAQ